MEEFIGLYAEYGEIGLVCAAFFYGYFKQSQRADEQAESLQGLKTENRGQSETLENMEGMIIKLINRWNQSDDKLDRKFDSITKEINDLDNQVSEIKGVISRLNGKS